MGLLPTGVSTVIRLVTEQELVISFSVIVVRQDLQIRGLSERS